MIETDVLIIGGGVVGLATAYRLTQEKPHARLTVLEKERELGCHQTGRNSGVLHSGIYYKPGSLKAQNCRAGKQAMERFCAEHSVPYEICGKVIVAVDRSEIAGLKSIYERGQQNGVKCERIDAARLRELEPHAAGIEAIYVPEAGIVNFRKVTLKLAELVQQRDGCVVTGARVRGVVPDSDSVVVTSTQGIYSAKYVVNCAGLYCDRVTKMSGGRPGAKIVPFRGEYYELKREAEHLCRNLIYPVPNPAFPFLGVHFTRMIDGGVECGPNAVFAFAREGYRKRDVNLCDLADSLTYPGFLKLGAKYWRVGAGEMWRSFSKAAFVKALQRLMPEIRSEHLVRGRAGVRAQAISPAGGMVDDFLIDQSRRVINVNNAPSPAATSALNIGAIIAEKLADAI